MTDTAKLLERVAAAIIRGGPYDEDYDSIIEDDDKTDEGSKQTTFQFDAPINDSIDGDLHEKIVKHIEANHGFQDADELGRGDLGIAFLFETGDVLKVTRDHSEANSSFKLVGKHNETISDIHDVFEFAGESGRPLYGILQERLEKPEASWVNFAEDWYLWRYTTGTLGKKIKRFNTPITRRNIEEFLGWVEQERDQDPDRREHFAWFVRLADELAKNEITFRDLHGGNIMRRKDGSHVVIDLGQSLAAPNKIPVVADAGGRINQIRYR
jgi:hypothetical protein